LPFSDWSLGQYLLTLSQMVLEWITWIITPFYTKCLMLMLLIVIYDELPTDMHCVSKEQGTCIMASDFHKHRALSMPFDRIIRAPVINNLPIVL